MTILLLVLSLICFILVGYFMAGVWKIIFEKDKSFIEMNKQIQKDNRAMLMKIRSELTHLGDTKGGRRRKSRHRRQNNNKTKRKYK